ncbi:MAG: TatD family hydrolase [Thermomicrobiales bacterium]
MSEVLPPIIDTHAHLDDKSFDGDREAMLDRARAVGVRRMLNIAYRPDIWDASVALRAAHPDIDLAAGLHPQDAAEFANHNAGLLAERLKALRPLAIGEAGFDFFRNGPSFDQQLAAFRWQIELSRELDLPLIIHQRAAEEELVNELDRWPDLPAVVLHSFDGGARLADWAIERGFLVGVGGLATRPKSAPLRDALARAPISAVLLETDAPYLAPPAAASRRNEPSNLPLVAGALAPLWDIDNAAFCTITTTNAERVFAWNTLAKSGPSANLV